MTKWLFNEWEQGKDNAHSRCNTRVDCRCRLYLHMLPTYYQYFFVGIPALFLVASLPESPKKALPHLLAKMIESQLLSRIWWGAFFPNQLMAPLSGDRRGIEGSKVMFIAWKVGIQTTNMEMSRANMEIEPQNMGIYGDVFHHWQAAFLWQQSATQLPQRYSNIRSCEFQQQSAGEAIGAHLRGHEETPKFRKPQITGLNAAPKQGWEQPRLFSWPSNFQFVVFVLVFMSSTWLQSYDLGVWSKDRKDPERAPFLYHQFGNLDDNDDTASHRSAEISARFNPGCSRFTLIYPIYSDLMVKAS